MKHIYYTCDNCKDKLPDGYEPNRDKLNIAIGHVVGGVQQEEEFDQRDICQKCLVKVVNKYFGMKNDFKEGITFLSMLGKKGN